MSTINKRVLGSDIPIRVKKILEARQRASSTLKSPNEEIKDSSYKDSRVTGGGESNQGFYTYGELLDNQFDGSYELGSRSPFTRMWTAVNLIKKVEKKIYFPRAEGFGPEDSRTITDRNKAIQDQKKKLQTDFPNTPIDWDVQRQQHYISDELDPQVPDRPFETKVYQVNSHDVGTLYPNQERYSTPSDSYEVLFPEEHNAPYFHPTHGYIGQNNEFLKPGAGITSVSSETQGAIGEIRKTTINFTVHNFYDFDKIYNKFFLKPGAQIFLDFGWSNENIELYDPRNFLDESKEYNGLSGIQNKLFDKNGWVGSQQGLVDTLVGIVQSYDSKIQENGSIECSLTITSRNTALLNQNTEETNIARKVSYILDHLITFEGLYQVSSNQERGILTGSLPDYNSSTNNIEDFQKTIRALARKSFGLEDDLTPGVNRTENDEDNPENAYDLSVPYGIFMNKKYDDLNFISFGLFEDKVINSELGFGETVDDINKSDHLNFEISMNSQDSFVPWIKQFRKRQEDIINYGQEYGPHADVPVFLYPEYWHDSYSARVGKLPRDADEEGYTYASYLRLNKTPPKYQEFDKMRDLSDYTKTDIFAKRIPLREIFINVNIIKKAFDHSESVREAIELILEKINEDSGDIFDLRITQSPGNDSSISVSDYNYDSLEKDDENAYDKLFTFDVMSNSSIVKSYDVNLSIPEGDVGNMYAIQNLSSKNQVFPNGTNIQKYMAAHSLLSSFGGNDDVNEITDYYFTYMNELDIFSHVEKLRGRTGPENKNLFGRYGKLVEDLNLMGKSRTVATTYDGHTLSEFVSPFSDGENIVPNPDEDGEEGDGSSTTQPSSKDISSENVQKKTSEYYNMLNIYAADSISEYHRVLAQQAFFTGKFVEGDEVKTSATALPISLSLTIYGISSIQPGDLFKVNYLPELYRNNVYFQVVKVSQDINSDGWYTTFETVMRIRRDSLKSKELYKPYSDVVLSPEFLKSIVGTSTDKIDSQSEIKEFDIKTVNEMTNLENELYYEQAEPGDLTYGVAMPEWVEDVFQLDFNRDDNFLDGGQYVGMPVDKLMDLVTIEKPVSLKNHNFTFLNDEAFLVRGNKVAIQEYNKGKDSVKIAFPAYHLYGSLNTNYSMLIGYPYVRGFSEQNNEPFIASSGGTKVERCHDFWDRIFAPDWVSDINCINKYYFLYDAPTVVDPLWSNYDLDGPTLNIAAGEGWIYAANLGDVPTSIGQLIYPTITEFAFSGYDVVGGLLPAGINIKSDELYMLVFNNVSELVPYAFYMLVPLNDEQDTNFSSSQAWNQKLSKFDHNIYFQNFDINSGDQPGGSLMQQYLNANFSFATGLGGVANYPDPCCWGWNGPGQPGRSEYSVGLLGGTFAESVKEKFRNSVIGESLGFDQLDPIGGWEYDGSKGKTAKFLIPEFNIPGIDDTSSQESECDESCPYYIDNIDNFFDKYLGGAEGSYIQFEPTTPFIPGDEGGSTDNGTGGDTGGDTGGGVDEEESPPMRRVGCMIEGDPMYDPDANEPCDLRNWNYLPYPTNPRAPFEFYTFECETGDFEGQFRCGGYVGHDGTQERKTAVDLYTDTHQDVDPRDWCQADGFGLQDGQDYTGPNKQNCCCVGNKGHSNPDENGSWWP